jgi:protein disulfide-isomerase
MQNQGRPDLYVAPPEDGELDHGADAGPGRGLKWLLVALAVAGAGLGTWKFLGSRTYWLDDMDRAVETARASGKPMLVFYTADWCPPCRQLKGGPLKDSKVKSFIVENYVPVKVDLTDRTGPGARSAAETGVTGIPTMIVYDAEGEETDRLVGGEIVEFLAGADR